MGNIVLQSITLLVCAILFQTHSLAKESVNNKAITSQKFTVLLKQADEADLKLNPLNGLTRGDLRYADQYGDLITDDYYRKVAASLRQRLSRLSGIDRDVLSMKEQIAYDVFRYQTEFALSAHQLGLTKAFQALPIDHLFGAHITFPHLSSGAGIAPFKTLRDYENGLRRINSYVTYLDRARQSMAKGVSSGQVHAKIIVEKIIEQLNTALKAGIEQSPFLLPTKSFPANFSAEDKRRFEKLYSQAINEKILPAFARLKVFMQDTYLPASRTSAPGLATLPGGAELYSYMLELHTTTRISAETIHNMGLSEVARIRAEMERIRRQVGFTGQLAEFFKYVQNDAKFQFKSREDLLDGYRTIQRRVEIILPKLFADLPKGGFEIRPVPTEQENSAGGAYYTVGTPDGSRPGVFYVNTAQLATRTSPRMTAIFLHEALPGHHFQGSLAQEDVTLPAMLRFSWNPGYGEGWALYCEALGEELGLYDDPYQYFGRLDMEIIRAARLVVDTGLHAKGWSREQAIRYMIDNSSLDRAAVEQEIDRYIVWPGQATAYKVGELLIKELRAKAQQKLGARFDIREFHRQVLNSGALPLHVLEKKIEQWIVNYPT